MTASTSLARFILRQALAIALLNTTINLAYTWWLWHVVPRLDLFGPGGVALDLAATPAVIGFLSTLLGTESARRTLASGRIALPRAYAQPFWLTIFPHSIFGRSLAIGAAAGLSMSLPIWLAFKASGLDTILPSASYAIKIGLTIPSSFLMVWWLVRATLADVQSGSVSTSTPDLSGAESRLNGFDIGGAR